MDMDGQSMPMLKKGQVSIGLEAFIELVVKERRKKTWSQKYASNTK